MIKLQDQQMNTILNYDAAFGSDFDIPFIDDDDLPEAICNSKVLTCPGDDDLWLRIETSREGSRCSENDENSNLQSVHLKNEINKFIPGVKGCIENFFGRPFKPNSENNHRVLLSEWNRFLHLEKGLEGTSVIEPPKNYEYISEFIKWPQSRLGAKFIGNNKKWIRDWLLDWNRFLKARAGESPVTLVRLIITFLSLFFYILDMVTDLGSAVFYAYNGKWWQFALTLLFVYVSIIVNTAWKWTDKWLYWTRSVDKLMYFVSLLVNWPDLKQCCRLYYLELKLCQSAENNAYLIPEWQSRRLNITRLKYVEGLWEACPQATLQLCLLLSDLHDEITLTDYLRTASTCLSLCTAGAALVNWDKFRTMDDCIEIPLSELFVLHMWAVPVAVCRLLCIALLLTMHVYWALACIVLHILLYSVYLCNSRGIPRTLKSVLDVCVSTIRYLISPYSVARSVTYRRVRHVVHFVCNTAVTVVWAVNTPLECAHPTLYTVLICFISITFAVGLFGWFVHAKHWPRSYINPWRCY